MALNSDLCLEPASPAFVQKVYQFATSIFNGDSLDMLHLYLSKDVSGGLNDQDTNAEDAGLVYTGGIFDPLIHQIGLAIAEELQASSKSNRLVFDTLSLALSARILQRHTRADDWARSDVYY